MSGKDTGIVNIHGREYKTVAKRVDEFRSKFGEQYGLITELVANDGESVVIRAYIANEDGRVVASGFAEERRNSSTINKTSAMENCETSAIGRALANFGFGGGEYASADEVANAVAKQAQVSSEGENKWDKYRINVDFDEIDEALSAIEELSGVDDYAAQLAKKYPKLTEKQKKTIGEKFNKRREELKQ